MPNGGSVTTDCGCRISDHLQRVPGYQHGPAAREIDALALLTAPPVRPFDDAAPPAGATDRGIPAPARERDGEATGARTMVHIRAGSIQLLFLKGGALTAFAASTRPAHTLTLRPGGRTASGDLVADARLGLVSLPRFGGAQRDAGQNRDARRSPRAARAKIP